MNSAYKIRVAQPEDATNIAQVHVDTWHSTYRGIMPDEVLDNLSVQDRAKKRRELIETSGPEYCSFVAESKKGKIVGFTVGGPIREPDDLHTSEILLSTCSKRFRGKELAKRSLPELPNG